MRFNCQSCGAKYQIADEKVAGKTVRMKCRKCETLIQVRARHEPDGSVEAEHVTGPPSVRPGAMPVPSRESRPPGPPPPSSRGGAPRPRASSLPRPSRPSSPGLPRPSRPSSPGIPAPRPSRPGGVPRPSGAKPSAPKPSAPKPSAPKPNAPKPSAAKASAAKAHPGEGTVVMADPRMEPSKAPEPDDDAVWYVGIDGEPVGPVGKAYLQEQIDAGKVKPGSLVWREGLTDWKPLSSFAELRSLLSARKPLIPPAAQVSAPVALTRKAAGAAAGTATELMPEGDQVAAAESSAAQKGPAEVSEEAPKAVVTAAEPSSLESAGSQPASPEPQPASLEPQLASPEPQPASPEPQSPPEPPDSEREKAAVPLGAAAAPAVVAAAEPSALEPAGVPARKPIHPMAWAFVAMAAAFGAVSAWFLFGKSDPPAPTAMNTGSAAAPAPGDPDATPHGVDAAPQGDGEAAGDGDEAASDGPDGAAPTRAVPHRAGQTAPGTEVSPASDGDTKKADDGGGDEPGKADKPCNPDDPFCTPGNVDGPSAKPKSGAGSESGAGLSQAEAASTVSRYRGSLMRRCRSLVTKGSAKVAATITVGPSGAVQSAAVSGGKEFPGLASCVQSRIMNWRFPASGGTSTISVSFNFL